MNPKQFLENFSTHLKNVIAKSISVAANFQHGAVTPLHLLLAISQEHGSVGSEILKKINLTSTPILDELSTIPKQPHQLQQSTKAAVATLPELSKEAKRALEKAMLLAYEYEHIHVGTEHLLAGLINGKNKKITNILESEKINPQEIQQQLEIIFTSTNKFPDVHDVAEIMTHIEEEAGTQENINPLSQQLPNAELPQKRKRQKTSSGNKALDMFAVELTDPTVQEQIDPVIGREKEIERLIHILCRRNKNNPVLVGEPGVGKTAIVEGLAKRIADGEVPAVLKNKKIFSIDLTLLVAGTIYRGEFEARIKQLVDEVSSRSDYILFIDEIHNIIGTGSNQGTMDAANILKPALARGKLRCIGATTFGEYKKYVTSDPALERRFQSLTVEEPTKEEAIQILHGIKKYYNKFHNALITDDAIEAAVNLSDRYIHNNFLPDKAIDLIDEAAAAVRTKIKPTKWQKQKFELAEELAAIKKDKDIAIEAEALDQATKLKKRLDALEKKIDRLESQMKDAKRQPAAKVTKKDIIHVLSNRLHLDKKILLQNQWEQLSSIEERLKKHIVGQDDVIQTIAASLKQTALGMHEKQNPSSSFLFAGPSGVGKTALATALAKELYHDEKALIRLDMSEFSEGYGVSKLLGSPAGYVGYKERNPFIDQIRQRPYAVVLFDEFDKAHPDVLKLLLQILDEGTLTDSQGKKVHFNHATIILTTNIGAELYKKIDFGFGTDKKDKHDIDSKRKKAIHEKMKDMFGTALLGRLHNIMLFSPLEKEHIEKIIEKHVDHINNQLKEQQKISLRLTKTALKQLIQDTHNTDTGARNVEKIVRKVIQELVVSLLQDETKKDRKPRYSLTRKNNAYHLQ